MFCRLDVVQQGNALSEQMAVVFQRTAGSLTGTTVLKQGQNQKMAFQNGAQGFTHQPQFGEFLRVRFRYGQASPRILEKQFAGDEKLEVGVNNPGKIGCRPAQEQLSAHETVYAANGFGNPLRCQNPVMKKKTGNQRGQRKNMQDIVAEIGKERRIALGHTDEVTERVGNAFDNAELFNIGEALARVEGTVNAESGIRNFAGKTLIMG